MGSKHIKADTEMEIDAEQDACSSGKRKRPTQSRHEAHTKPTQSPHKKMRSDAKSAELTGGGAAAVEIDEEDELLSKELEKINIGARTGESEDHHARPPRSSAPVANYYLALNRFGSGPNIRMPVAVLATQNNTSYANALGRIGETECDDQVSRWKPVLSTLWQRTGRQTNSTGD